MEFNGISALKHIRYLEDEKQKVLEAERNSATTVIVDGKEVKTEGYNFIETRKKVNEIDDEIAQIRHALNLFNTTTIVMDNITIDMALVELAQKNRELDIVRGLRGRAKESYESGYRESYIRKTNYSHDEVDKYHQILMKEIHTLQMKIDEANIVHRFTV